MASTLWDESLQARSNDPDEKNSQTTQQTDPKPQLDSTCPDHGAESDDMAEDAGEKEMPGALQQIMTRNEQISTHILIWLLVFILGFSSSIFKVLTPYVVSDFKRHALTATTDVVANIASGVFRLPYAKLLDVWGRPHSLTRHRNGMRPQTGSIRI
ncbi:hypothetical protein Daesc_001177 [Daldinia eschscholtzii]|uniref:Uncharacterized protein n=1 Tax=Daldinia eschscholtzii TaxID=292717 RepID=A0AAX6N0G1_9PEZI